MPRYGGTKMRTAPVSILFVGAAIVLAGCGEADDPSTTGGSGAGAGPSTSAGPGAGGSGPTGSTGSGVDPEAWKPIIIADWQLSPGSENTSDSHTVTVEKDVYIGAIRPIAPVGTHHTVLAIGGLGTGNIIYASGVGTNPLVFPKGVGLKLVAGETLVLQLHLFNTSAEILKGTSGIEIIEVAPEDVEQEADLYLPGPIDFSIPPNAEYTHVGTCTAAVKQNIFAIFPHMHQLGSHFKSTLTVGGVDKVIHDGEYQFDHQAFIPFEPIAIDAGDKIKTECTWTNTTTNEVGWGESSTTEMCFSILYRYPAQGGGGAGFCTK
jgi:hypothetical protein